MNLLVNIAARFPANGQFHFINFDEARASRALGSIPLGEGDVSQVDHSPTTVLRPADSRLGDVVQLGEFPLQSLSPHLLNCPSVYIGQFSVGVPFAFERRTMINHVPHIFPACCPAEMPGINAAVLPAPTTMGTVVGLCWREAVCDCADQPRYYMELASISNTPIPITLMSKRPKQTLVVREGEHGFFEKAERVAISGTATQRVPMTPPASIVQVTPPSCYAISTAPFYGTLRPGHRSLLRSRCLSQRGMPGAALTTLPRILNNVQPYALTKDHLDSNSLRTHRRTTSEIEMSSCLASNRSQASSDGSKESLMLWTRCCFFGAGILRRIAMLKHCVKRQLQGFSVNGLEGYEITGELKFRQGA